MGAGFDFELSSSSEELEFDELDDEEEEWESEELEFISEELDAAPVRREDRLSFLCC